METLEQILFTDNTAGGLFVGFLLTGILTAAVQESKKGFKYVFLPIYGLFLIFTLYKAYTIITESDKLLTEEEYFHNSIDEWGKSHPEEKVLFSTMEIWFNQDDCILCGKPSAYGTVTYLQGHKPGKAKKGIVCKGHKNWLDLYLNNRNEALHLLQNSKLDSVAVSSILTYFIDGEDFSLNKAINNKSISQEDMLEKLGFIFGVFISFSIMLRYAFKNYNEQKKYY